MTTASTTPIDSFAADFVDQMARYVGLPGVPPLMVEAEKAMGALRLRRICIGVLSWLKGRRRFVKRVAMKLTEFGSAQNELIDLLKSDPSFAAVLALTPDGKGVQVSEAISPEGILQMIEVANLHYNPPVFVTRRVT